MRFLMIRSIASKKINTKPRVAKNGISGKEKENGTAKEEDTKWPTTAALRRIATLEPARQIRP